MLAHPEEDSAFIRLLFAQVYAKVPHRYSRSKSMNVIVLLVLLVTPVLASRRSEIRDQGRPRVHTASYCMSCERDSTGRIKRSTTARRHFRAEHPCPVTGLTAGHCPGFVIDHIQALKHGGADVPSNMQWETRSEARAKDHVE